MDEAPIPNPAAAESVLPSSAPSQKAMSEMPSSPRPPTDKPITAPPLYDTASAPAWPSFLAAIAVRPFAEVAARIPEKPANTEAMAPAKNATAVSRSLSCQSATPTIPTKMVRIRYSANRNAIAPF